MNRAGALAAAGSCEFLELIMNKMRLFTPGPTSVPEEVLLEMAKPVFHHRTQQYKDLFAKVNELLKYVYQTKNPVLTISGSGTAGAEMAMINRTCR